jgi:predicted secreted protein
MLEMPQPHFPNWSGNNDSACRLKKSVIGMCARPVIVMAFAVAMSWSSAQPALPADSNDSWREIANNVFNGRPLADGSQLITLEMPERAEDAAIVPVTMRASLPAGDTRTLRSLTLVID